jgi:Domain of unknown function (DUF4388)
LRLEGSLDAFSLPDIFSLLSMTKKTGGLHLRRAESHGVVWLGDGLITGGASDLRMMALGRRLACSGQLDDELLAEAVEHVAGNREIGLARALHDSQAIDEGELHAIVSEHVVDTVFDLMRWPDGEFEFVVDEPNIDDVGVTREVEEVVGEARQRLENWAAIDRDLASPTAVLSLALAPAGDPSLTHDEWALLALVDGRRTINELVAMRGRGEYAVVVALAELVARGLILIGNNEPVSSLLSRMDLISSLEPEGSAAPAVSAQLSAALTEVAEAPAAEPAGIDTEVAEPSPVAMALAGGTDAGDEPEVEGAGEQVAALASLPRSSSLDREIASVTPQRPEPFLPSREPEHPEPLAAAAAGGAVATPMPAGAIERDPSVNKSLLLRLIAGVRGL